MTRFLLVTDPPHAEGLDRKRLGSLLGGTAMEAAMRARYSVPEIWDEYEDEDMARQRLEVLEDCGLHCAIFTIEQLMEVPDPAFVDYFEVTPDAMTVFETGIDNGVKFSWEAVRYVVRWEMTDPEAGKESVSLGDRIRHARIAGKLKGSIGTMRGGLIGMKINLSRLHAANESFKRILENRRSRMFSGFDRFLDIYISLPAGGAARFRIQQNKVDFTGLGEHLQLNAGANWNVLISLLRAAVGKELTDTRAIKVAPRVPPCGLDFLTRECGPGFKDPQVLTPLLCYLTGRDRTADWVFDFDPYKTTATEQESPSKPPDSTVLHKGELRRRRFDDF